VGDRGKEGMGFNNRKIIDLNYSWNIWPLGAVNLVSTVSPPVFHPRLQRAVVSAAGGTGS